MSKSLLLKYSISLVIAFALLAAFVGNYPINTLDLSVSHHIQQIRNPWLDQLMSIVSKLGDVAFAFSFMLIAASLFFIFRYKREAAFVLAISGTGLITFILKRVFDRARPTEDHVTLLDIYHNNSFPSGHTLSYVVFFGFLIFLICSFAECNRTPFDLPEAENELIGGYHTEYSSMKLGFYLFSEYINMFISSVIMSTLFFGGYDVPFFDEAAHADWGNWLALIGIGALMTKAIFFIFLFMWVRWTIPRFRYDQLMHLGWKTLIPLALVNLLITGAVILAFAN